MYTVRIEMIHDVVCSWCAIGYHHLKSALEELQDLVTADLHYLPFELNPDMPPEGEEIVAHMNRRLGWSEEQVLAYRRDLIPRGLRAGVHFDFMKRTHYYNTFEAHCLMHWAETRDRQTALHEALLHAYHTEGVNLADRQALLRIAAHAGLDRDAAEQALASGKLLAPVRNKLQRVGTLKIKSVPAFLFNGEQLVSGSNSVEFFRDYLLELIEKSSTAASAA